MIIIYRLVNRNLDNYKLLSWNELKLWSLMKQLILNLTFCLLKMTSTYCQVLSAWMIPLYFIYISPSPLLQSLHLQHCQDMVIIYKDHPSYTLGFHALDGHGVIITKVATKLQ